MPRKKKTDVNENEEGYYRLDRILKENADYNVIYGGRSNGKTYAALEYGLKHYLETGRQFAYVRRWDIDIREGRASQLFSGIVANKLVEKYTKGQWNNIVYSQRRFYLSIHDEKLDKDIYSEDPIGYAFTLTSMEHDKSTSYPNVDVMIFDEFASRNEMVNEFVLFSNTVSTLARNYGTLKIFMLANTVDKHNVYFLEMGLNNVTKQQQGTIDIYKFGELKIACEYCKPLKDSMRKSDKLFAFNNPKLKMITGGEWEMDVYPHLSVTYKRKDVLGHFFIIHLGCILHGELVEVDDMVFCYIHRKTTPLKYNYDDLIYQTKPVERYMTRTSFNAPITRLEKTIGWCFKYDKVFYQDNDVGEIVRKYCETM